MKKILRFNEYKSYRLNEADDNEESDENIEDGSEPMDLNDISADTEDEVDDSVYKDVPEDSANGNLVLLKNKLEKIFTDSDELGVLDNIEIDDNYTSKTVKLKYNDNEFQYNCYIRMPLEDILKKENGGERAELKMKKYSNGELIGQVDKTVDISEINSEMLIKMNSELDEKYSSEDDDMGLEYEE